MAIALAGANSAQAYQPAPGWTATDYATGFAHSAGSDGSGPVGVVFDPDGNLLVSDVASATLHKVPPGGGSADATRLRGGYGQAAGLTFDKTGRLYMARGTQHDVVELNPASGEIIRTVASGLPCPVGLATDPISGDLFVSNAFCPGGSIMRISGFANGPGLARAYAGTQDADGLTFAPDGTLYAAGGMKVIRIEGTGSSSPGKVSDVAAVPKVDGIVYAPATTLDDEYLVVVRNDGEIDRLDFDGRLTAVVTGASRGDLVTVGPDRCIYAALQDRVIKVGPATGQCNFAPPGGQDVLGQRAARRVVDTAIKASAPKWVKQGSRFTLTLKTADRSKIDAHTVTVTDTIPKGSRLVRVRSVRGVSCKHRKRTVTCRKSSLAKGQSFNIRIVVRGMFGKAYANTARAKSNDLDPVPGNNKSRSTTRVR
jgi:sugar lactone lactonase YvrE